MRNKVIKFLKEKLGLWIFAFFTWFGFNAFVFYVVSIEFNFESYKTFKMGFVAGISAMYLINSILNDDE